MTLSRQQSDVLHWLRRRGQCTTRQARAKQIDQATLDFLVEAGLVEHIEGVDPIYRAVMGDRPTQAILPALPVTPSESPKLQKLTRQQEYVERWLRREGQCTLRQALSQGIETETLEALVAVGLVIRVEADDPIYKTATVPTFQPAEEQPGESQRPIPTKASEPRVVQPLPRQLERVIRWLRRAGQCSLRQANARGMDRAELDALVTAGYAERIEGDDPIYKTISVRTVKPADQTAGPTRPLATPTPTPTANRVLVLLGDGLPRSAREIATALSDGRGFTGDQQLGREIQRALPILASRGFVRRVLFGVPVGPHQPEGGWDAKFVNAKAVLPVCQPCFKQHWGAEAIPPQASGQPIELCAICRRRTNDPSYLPKAEVLERTAK